MSNAPPETINTPPEAHEGPSAPSSTAIIRLRTVALVLGLIALTVLAVMGADPTGFGRPLYGPLPNPYQPSPKPLSIDWPLSPVEYNAFKRLPNITAQLSGFHAAKDGKLLWAVGDGATIVHSQDGGQTWQSQHENIRWQREPVQRSAPAEKAAAFSLPSPIRPASAAEQSLPRVKTGAADIGNAEKANQASALSIEQNSASSSKGGSAGDTGGGRGADTGDVSSSGSTTGDIGGDGDTGSGPGDVPEPGPGSGSSSELAPDPSPDLTDVFFIDTSRGWAVGRDGTILATNDAGQNWQPQSSGTKAWLYSVQFLNDGRGWAVGDDGTILATNDAGQNWIDSVHYTLYPAPWYYALLMLLAAALVVVVRTLSRKSTESDKEPLPQSEASYPSSTSKLKSNPETDFQEPEHDKNSISEEGVSDRPLAWGDTDYLGFKPIARGLSRLLRNENTEPPLTVAITGPWGSGKSSLMNLLCEELVGWEFRPVWFNVWHHQQEEHLLASLLRAIKNQHVPPVYTWAGIRFRGRMLAFRSHWFWLWGILALLAALYLVAPAAWTYITNREERGAINAQMLYQIGLNNNAVITERGVRAIALKLGYKNFPGCRPKDHTVSLAPIPRVLCKLSNQPYESKTIFLDRVEESIAQETTRSNYKLTGELRQTILKHLEHVPPAQTSTFDPSQLGKLGASLLSIALLLFAFVSGVSQFFGVTPLLLLKKLGRRLENERPEEAVGFRQRFRSEFAVICKAVRPHTLMLVFDDLDRCAPQYVVQVLETINYLVSSGTCYVVMGMDRHWVEACVRLHYEDVAQELSRGNQDNGEPGEPPPGERGWAVGDDGTILATHDGGSTWQAQSSGTDARLASVQLMPESNSGNGPQRRDFAFNYLEKLINIEVPIPKPEAVQSEALLSRRREAREPRPLRVKQRLRALVKALRREKPSPVRIAAPILSLGRAVSEVAWLRAGLGVLHDLRAPLQALVWALVVVFALWLAGDWHYVKQPNDQWTTSESLPIPATASGEEGNNSSDGGASVIVRELGKVKFEPGPEVTVSPGLLLTPLVLLAIILVLWRLGRPISATLSELPEIRLLESDTRSFQDALQVWHPWVVLLNSTPRAIKRYKNRVRYLAGRQRDAPAPRNLLEQFLSAAYRWLSAKPPETVPEPLLVALGAVYHCDPRWLENDEIFQAIIDGNLDAVPIEERIDLSDQELTLIRKQLTEAIRKHHTVFPDLELTFIQRDRFLVLAGGISTV